MVETAKAADAIDGITSVEGLDAVFVGPADLAITYGYAPSDQRNEKMVAVLTRVVESCKTNGVLAGTAPLTLDDARVAAEIGFDFFAIGSDLSFMGVGAASVAAQAASFGKS
jgi:4-hydroxy-2-oxoheptanedioate aldolase